MSIPDKIPQLSAQTSNILSLVTDPYHDYNLKACGYPDGNISISAIKRIQGRTTVSCPFTLAANESWDFHVFNSPFHYQITLASSTLGGNTFTKQATSVIMGPVNIFYRKYDSLGAVSATIFEALGNSAPLVSDTSSKQVRTVSLGFELHNTTAELYKSGSLTTYRTPVVYNDVGCWYKNGATTVPFSTKVIGSIPISIDAINLLPNSRTWEAFEGAYIVALPAPVNTLSPFIPTNVVIQGGLTLDNYNLLYDGSYQTNVAIGKLQTFSPLACGGVMSSRFKDVNQTFALDFRQILEEVPNSADSTTLAYCTSAPELDRVFMKLYKAMFNQIPPGVPVRFNSAGDWFRSIIRVVKDTLPSLVPLLPGQAKVIAAGVLPIVNQVLDKTILKPKLDTTQRLTTSNTIKKALKQPGKPKRKAKPSRK